MCVTKFLTGFLPAGSGVATKALSIAVVAPLQAKSISPNSTGDHSLKTPIPGPLGEPPPSLQPTSQCPDGTKRETGREELRRGIARDDHTTDPVDRIDFTAR